MDSADALLGGLASGDPAPPDAPHAEPTMKRDQDSTDDFEHLERDGRREGGESPHLQSATATRSFIDMERELLAAEPRAPSASDHIADKFTDSESDADTAGESPMHRAETGRIGGITPEPPRDPTPVLAPHPAPSAPVAPEKPLPEEPKPATAPEPKPEPPKSDPPKVEPVKSEPIMPVKPAAPEPMRPTAHVIEAEVIFCQMGLGKNWNSAWCVSARSQGAPRRRVTRGMHNDADATIANFSTAEAAPRCAHKRSTRRALTSLSYAHVNLLPATATVLSTDLTFM